MAMMSERRRCDWRTAVVASVLLMIALQDIACTRGSAECKPVACVPAGIISTGRAVVYVQPIRFDPTGYNSYAERLVGNLCAQVGASRLRIVLWPERTPGRVRVWTGEDYLKDPGSLLAALLGGRGWVDPSGFGVGLQKCAEIAEEENADVVVVAHRVEFLTDVQESLDLMMLRDLSTKHVVHLVVYDGPVGELTKVVSGYAVSVSLGDVARQTGP